jgi:predicted MFS family arabinose efflux permease
VRTAPHQPPRFRPILDRPTRIAYVQLAAFAWFMYAFGASQALLRDDQGVSKTIASLHGTFLALGGILGALLAARVINHFGRGPVMRVAALCTALGIAVYTIPAGVQVTWFGAFAASLFGTILLITLNAFLLDYQGPAGAAALTEANALASFAGILGPLAIGIAAITVLGWRVGMWIAILGFIAVEVWRGRDIAVFSSEPHVTRDRIKRPLPPGFWWSPILISLFLATEFSMMFWSPDLLRDRTGFVAASAAASVGVLTAGMLVGRFLGSRLAQRWQPNTLLIWSVLLALAAFIVVWTSSTAPVILTGMFFMGAGLGLHWPLGVARAVIASDGQTDRAAALASIFGSAAIGLAPFALGALADATSVHLSFLLLPLFLVLALIILILRPVRAPIVSATIP